MNEAKQNLLEIIKTAAADCRAQGNTMAANELLDAATTARELVAALTELLAVDRDSMRGVYRADRESVQERAERAIAKATSPLTP